MIEVAGIGQLRAPEPEDLHWLYAVENDVNLLHLSAEKEPFSRETLRRYLESQPGSLQRDGQIRLIIEVDQKPIGALDLFEYDFTARKAGVGIVLDAAYRGKGWAREALNTFVEHAFNHWALSSLYAHVPASNEASQRLFEGAGFVKIGLLERWIWRDGTFEAAWLYQKLNGHE